MLVLSAPAAAATGGLQAASAPLPSVPQAAAKSAAPPVERPVAGAAAASAPPVDSLPPAARQTWLVAAGAGLPGQAVMSLALERGLYSILALHVETRLSASLSRGPVRPGLALLAGPTMVVDMLAYVPRLFLLAGVEGRRSGLHLAPAEQQGPAGEPAFVTPALAWGCQLDRFISVHTHVGVRLVAMWTAKDGVRGDAMLSVGYTP